MTIDEHARQVVTVRVEPNIYGKIIWRVDGFGNVKATGFADSHADAMRDAAAFVEAAAQPRSGTLWGKTGLRTINGGMA